MTGWRIGWMAGPADFISQALKALQNSITNLPPFIQMGALTALTNRTVSKAADMMAAKYTQRRDLAQEIIRQAGLRIMPPQGAFYLFLDFRDLCVDSSTMAKEILEEQKVCTVPGSVYGQCGEGFLRVSLSVPDDVLFEGLKRIVRWYDGKQTRASYPSQRSMSCA
jgi:aspartate/methionine/tyrosine aminotransferase